MGMFAGEEHQRRPGGRRECSLVKTTNEGRELEEMLDKNKFFRLNRKFIAQVKAIERFKSDNGKIKVYLKPAVNDEIHVSKETALSFRLWIGGD